MSVYLIFMYKYRKRKEDEGIEFAMHSSGDIAPIILSITIAIGCFVKMTGLWELLIRWLSSTK